MVTELVNGILRQVFDFSKPDGVNAKFYAPVSLGAGYRKRIDLAKTNKVMDSGTWQIVLDTLLTTRKMPNGMDKKQWQEEILDQAQNIILSKLDIADMGDSDLAVLKTLLTPAADSMSVEVWYYEHAEEWEVELIINFSEGLVLSKTGTETESPVSGQDTAEVEQSPAPLLSTSPPPIED